MTEAGKRELNSLQVNEGGRRLDEPRFLTTRLTVTAPTQPATRHLTHRPHPTVAQPHVARTRASVLRFCA